MSETSDLLQCMDLLHDARLDSIHHATDKAALRNALDTALTRIRELERCLLVARAMIRGETIEGAVVNLQTMQSLGNMLDAALSKDLEK